RNLSGQTYVDSYATKPSKPVAAPAEPAVPTAPAAETDDRPVAPVIPIDRPHGRPVEPAAASTDRSRPTGLVVASAAAGPTQVAVDSDGVDRRSSAAVIRSRPLDLDALALTGA
ncbi:MAG TPA: hypothetical protein P5193_16290, partial [Microthrixaceae bacterium]|nr:hypothetical protein [Microthrixaceae bacterium]